MRSPQPYGWGFFIGARMRVHCERKKRTREKPEEKNDYLSV